MGNFTLKVRIKRWVRFFGNYVNERLHGLDFSMVYVGQVQREVREFHGYSMTDAKAMKKMLQAVPVDVSQASFLDVGCGKGMCMKCAVESGYQKVAGLDLDPYLVEIANRNMKRLDMDVACICANAIDFDGYADYDVFYFYNPFGRQVFEQVVPKIRESQNRRNRDIWVIYYHPSQGDLFENAGFVLKNETKDDTRDTVTRYYCCPKQEEQ